MDKNHEAKREFRAYIDDAKAKVAFLGELAQTGHNWNFLGLDADPSRVDIGSSLES
jgi:hypothetical protein